MALIILVVLFLAALAVRIGRKDHTPILRCKSGESTNEARLILRGTFRVYTWTLVAALGSSAFRGIFGEHGPWWIGLFNIGFGTLLLILAHAVYWRLGLP